MKRSITFLTMAAMIALAVPASGQWAALTYGGYAWVEGGFPSSAYGDLFFLVGTANTVDDEFEVDLDVDELTLYMYDLMSWGEVWDDVAGIWTTQFADGYLDIWRDDQRNAVYGENPPNATAPSTFTDGTLFFRGPFLSMNMVRNPDGTGNFVGELSGEEGEMLGDIPCYGCVITFGGTFNWQTGAQIPEGYDLQITGTLLVSVAVSTEQSTWSRVKALFN